VIVVDASAIVEALVGADPSDDLLRTVTSTPRTCSTWR